jgi:catechol 2,3-dioxygenase
MSYAPSVSGYFNVFVRDIARAKAWYAEMLGLHVDPANQSAAATLFFDPEAYGGLTLVEICGGAPPSLRQQVGRTHTTWHCDSLDDLVAFYRRAKAMNVAIEHIDRQAVSLSLFARDPDGNVVEIYYQAPGTDLSEQDAFDGQFYGRGFFANCAFPGPWDADAEDAERRRDHTVA